MCSSRLALRTNIVTSVCCVRGSSKTMAHGTAQLLLRICTHSQLTPTMSHVVIRVIATRSIVHARVPEQKDTVRAILLPTGYIISPTVGAAQTDVALLSLLVMSDFSLVAVVVCLLLLHAGRRCGCCVIGHMLANLGGSDGQRECTCSERACNFTTATW